LAETMITRTINVNPDAAWDLLADFGDVRWIPGIDGVVVDGDGPGMHRRIPVGAGDPIDEQLLSIDHDTRVLVYSIENNPMPTTEYRAACTVRPSGDGTEIQWSVTFEPIGDEGEVAGIIQSVYGMMAEWIETALAGR
jgi:carbon monoxide dehydrogenase subunit G